MRKPVEKAEVFETLTHRLQEVLDNLVSRKEVPHAIVAVKRGDDSFQWIGAAGNAGLDGTPMRANTPYFIASVDKLFTATVVLKLHERGYVDLERPGERDRDRRKQPDGTRADLQVPVPVAAMGRIL